MEKLIQQLSHATEMAAIAAYKFKGSGKKEEADKAATEAMRTSLNSIDFKGIVAISEGKKDKSYTLEGGETVGESEYETYDLSLDPIEGTRPLSLSLPEAISVLAVANKNSMLRSEYFYANKLVYGPKIRNKTELFINDPLEKTVNSIFEITKSPVTACVLDRQRHQEIIQNLKKLNVNIKLIQDCDISAALLSCMGGEINFLYNIGGLPEAVISACGVKCLGGDIQIQIVENNTWKPIGDVLKLEDLVKGECAFCCTGITDGCIVEGVKYDEGYITNSLLLSSQKVINITTWHKESNV